MATPHDITLKEVGIFKIWDSRGWERRTQMSLELQNKKCDLVLKSSELIFFWNSLIWNIWMNEIPFRGVWAACASLWTASCFSGARAALASVIYWEGINKKKLEMETWIWMHFAAEANQSVPTELNFLCLFPGIDSLLKLAPLPSLLLPGSLMEWQIFREVKVKRSTSWCPVITFALYVLGGYSRKFLSHFPQQYSLDQNLMSCSTFLQDARQQDSLCLQLSLEVLALVGCSQL